MHLNFDRRQCFAVPDSLCQLLNDELTKLTTPNLHAETITFNFRDPDYSALGGGSHPVEIRLVKHQLSGKTVWQFEYITDFSYQGFPHAELTKEIDVCFRTKEVYHLYGGSLNRSDGEALMTLFLENFVSYYQMDVFKVTVSFD